MAGTVLGTRPCWYLAGTWLGSRWWQAQYSGERLHRWVQVRSLFCVRKQQFWNWQLFTTKIYHKFCSCQSTSFRISQSKNQMSKSMSKSMHNQHVKIIIQNQRPRTVVERSHLSLLCWHSFCWFLLCNVSFRVFSCLCLTIAVHKKRRAQEHDWMQTVRFCFDLSSWLRYPVLFICCMMLYVNQCSRGCGMLWLRTG